MFGGLTGKVDDLIVRRATDRNDLFDGQAVIEKLAGQHEMAEILFRADGAVLHLAVQNHGTA